MSVYVIVCYLSLFATISKVQCTSLDLKAVSEVSSREQVQNDGNHAQQCRFCWKVEPADECRMIADFACSDGSLLYLMTEVGCCCSVPGLAHDHCHLVDDSLLNSGLDPLGVRLLIQAALFCTCYNGRVVPLWPSNGKICLMLLTYSDTLT